MRRDCALEYLRLQTHAIGGNKAGAGPGPAKRRASRFESGATAAAEFARGANLVTRHREVCPECKHLAFLFQEYDPACWYFEVLECARRLALTCVLPLPQSLVRAALRRRARPLQRRARHLQRPATHPDGPRRLCRRLLLGRRRRARARAAPRAADAAPRADDGPELHVRSCQPRPRRPGPRLRAPGRPRSRPPRLRRRTARRSPRASRARSARASRRTSRRRSSGAARASNRAR